MSVELPQDRVKAFIEAHDSWEGADEDYLTHSGGYSSTTPPSIRLTKTDLRDVLNDLEEHQRMLAEIDEVLDMYGHEPYAAFVLISNIMGNNTYKKREV